MPFRAVAPVFQTSYRFKGADPITKRSLAMAVLDIPAIHRLEDACKSLKLEYKVPIWQKDVWAHLGLVNLDVVIFISSTLDEVRTEDFRERWWKYRWKLLGVSVRSIERTPATELVDHLKGALRELGKRV